MSTLKNNIADIEIVKGDIIVLRSATELRAAGVIFPEEFAMICGKELTVSRVSMLNGERRIELEGTTYTVSEAIVDYVVDDASRMEVNQRDFLDLLYG